MNSGSMTLCMNQIQRQSLDQHPHVNEKYSNVVHQPSCNIQHQASRRRLKSEVNFALKAQFLKWNDTDKTTCRLISDQYHMGQNMKDVSVLLRRSQDDIQSYPQRSIIIRTIFYRSKIPAWNYRTELDLCDRALFKQCISVLSFYVSLLYSQPLYEINITQIPTESTNRDALIHVLCSVVIPTSISHYYIMILIVSDSRSMKMRNPSIDRTN